MIIHPAVLMVLLLLSAAMAREAVAVNAGAAAELCK